MSKKESNSFFFEGDKVPCDFFEEETEEDKNEIQKIRGILSNNPVSKVDNDDDKDLNNITSVSETDKVYIGEKKYESKKPELIDEIQDELNETSLTVKNSDNDDEKNQKEIIEDNNNIINNNLSPSLENNLKTNLCNTKNNFTENDYKEFIIEKNNKFGEINEQHLFGNLFNLNSDYEIKDTTKNENNKKSNKKRKRSNINFSINSINKFQRSKSPIFLIKKIKKRSRKIRLTRKKKEIHINRKKDSDTIRRKIKTYFHNYLLELLNSKIQNVNFGKEFQKKKINKFLKFNNKFTTTVNISLNRSLLSKKISTIIKEEPISNKYRSFDIKNNYHLIKYLLSIKTYPEIRQILNSTYSETFANFLKSGRFQLILKKIKNKDGEIYMKQFKSVADNFISYYNVNIPRKQNKDKIFVKDKNKDYKENFFECSISDLSESEIFDSNISNFNDFIFYKKFRKIKDISLFEDSNNNSIQKKYTYDIYKSSFNENNNNSINSVENIVSEINSRSYIFNEEDYLKNKDELFNNSRICFDNSEYMKSSNIFGNIYNFEKRENIYENSIFYLKKISNDYSKTDETEFVTNNLKKYNFTAKEYKEFNLCL